MSTPTWIGLQLAPLDTLFFRDSRPFAAATRAEGGLPNPQTLAGALRTALLFGRIDFNRLAERRRAGLPADQALLELGAPEWIVRSRFRGPWLARVQEGEGKAKVEPVLPVPMILARQGQEWVRSVPLLPSEVPGWPQEHAIHPLWRYGAPDAKHPGGFLTLEGIRRFLQGTVPENADWLPASDLYHFEDRTGIAINPVALTSAEGQIYGIRLLVLKRNVCLYAEMCPGPGAPDNLQDVLPQALPLGGEGRHVRVEVLSRSCDWPEDVPQKNARSLWLLATPALLDNTGQPEVPLPARVVAAATSTPMAVSGWDVARNGPHRTRFAVPAGAVYFVEGTYSPAHGSFCIGENDAQGWGFALRGVWNYD